MKKKLIVCLAAMLVVNMMAGCSLGEKFDKSNEEEESSVEYTDNAETDSSETDSAESDRVNVWDYDVEDYMTLGEYKDLAVTVGRDAVTEEQVNSQAFQFYLNQVSKENGGVVDRAVATGDTVVMDYVGKQDGVAFDGGTDQNATLTIGSGQFIDGFEDGLIGVMPGETVDLNLTFPKDYHSEEMAGAEVVFTVTVHYIQPTEMEDEAVAGFGNANYKNVEELKQYTRDALEAQAEYYYQLDLEAAIMSVLLANCTFKELPEALLKQSEQTVKSNIDTTAAMYGVDGATYVAYFYQMDYDAFVAENAEFSTQVLLAMLAVAEEEGLFPKGEKLDEQLEELALNNNLKSADELLQYYDLDVLTESILQQNVLEYLIENTQVSEP